MKNKLWLHALIHSIALLFYVSGVAWIMQNGEKIFGQMQNFWGPVAFLLLFVFSALISGILVLGRPIFLFLTSTRQEAVRMLFYTVGWMFVLTAAVLLLNLAMK